MGCWRACRGNRAAPSVSEAASDFSRLASFPRWQAGRFEPLADVRADLCLAGSANGTFTLDTRRKQSGFLVEAQCLFCKAFFQGCNLFETASHGAAPFRRKAGAQLGVLITDKSQRPSGDAASVRYRTLKSESYRSVLGTVVSQGLCHKQRAYPLRVPSAHNASVTETPSPKSLYKLFPLACSRSATRSRGDQPGRSGGSRIGDITLRRNTTNNLLKSLPHARFSLLSRLHGRRAD